jgi:hypothetical protein
VALRLLQEKANKLWRIQNGSMPGSNSLLEYAKDAEAEEVESERAGTPVPSSKDGVNLSDWLFMRSEWLWVSDRIYCLRWGWVVWFLYSTLTV